MSIHDEVNLIIFRIPDELDPANKEHEHDDGFRLVEMPYLGRKLADTGTIFLPHQDDVAYRSIDFDRIVLARTVAEGSRELMRYQLVPNEGEPTKVYEMGYEDLVTAIEHLVKEYDEERANGESGAS